MRRVQPPEIDPERAGEVDAVWSFVIGEERTDVLVHGGVSSIVDAPVPEPTVMVRCDASTWEQLLAGDLAPQVAWALGHLEVTGDMRLAQRTRAIFAF